MPRTTVNGRDTSDATTGRETLTRRRPVATFVLIAFAIGWPALAIPAVTGLPDVPFLLVLLFVALLGPALLVTRWADGPGAVRRLGCSRGC